MTTRSGAGSLTPPLCWLAPLGKRSGPVAPQIHPAVVPNVATPAGNPRRFVFCHILIAPLGPATTLEPREQLDAEGPDEAMARELGVPLEERGRRHEQPTLQLLFVIDAIRIALYGPLMTTPSGYSFRINTMGDSEVTGEIASPLSRELESILPYRPVELPDSMRQSGAICNVFGGGIILELTLYVAAGFAVKAIGDVYTTLIQPRIKPYLEKCDRKLGGANIQAKKTVTVSMWYEEYQALVSVSMVGNSFDDVAKQLDRSRTIHADALADLTSGGTQKQAYYKIECGKISGDGTQ